MAMVRGVRAALLPMVSLAAMAAMIGAPARAQSCNSAVPPPTPPPVGYASNGQTFGQGFQYLFYPTDVLPGCAGVNTTSGEFGGDAFPGQPGRQLTVNTTNATLFGSFPLNGAQWKGYAGTVGGAGGSGGDANNDDGNRMVGGIGGPGGAAGGIGFTFSGRFVADGTAAGVGVQSVGGAGGEGGSTKTSGQTAKYGGAGGPGGAGGAVTAAIDLTGGSAAAPATGAPFIVGSLGGTGGPGGTVSTSDAFSFDEGGAGGAGGAAGTVAATLNTAGAIVFPGLVALVESVGGTGGFGGDSLGAFQNTGGAGGAGGAGGSASLVARSDASGVVQVKSALGVSSGRGLVVQADGGAGGYGRSVSGGTGNYGGKGGQGGAGGQAGLTLVGQTLTLDETIQSEQPSFAVLVSAGGGDGGAGGTVGAVTGAAGGGGFAGAGGRAAFTLDGGAAIRTAGLTGVGAAVQAIGGGGGNGGTGNFLESGGAGAAGGNGGSAAATLVNGAINVGGGGGVGLVAQSIGGGGGVGGSSNGVTVVVSYNIGGNGGLGGDGRDATVEIGDAAGVVASGEASGSAVVVQSIGGSGGVGGSATARGSGLVQLTVGGDAGGGGAGGTANLTSAGLVGARGDHGIGLLAQSVGGGGGKGGGAFNFNVGAVGAASVAVGGRGGGGGPGGSATLLNTGQVQTYGADGHALVAQSVGGGGGIGGEAVAKAAAASGGNVPAVSVAVSIGGKGGAGNTAGAASATNSGLAVAGGQGAHAMLVQSVGGGGGAGGDSTASAYAGGPTAELAVSVSVAVGGSGGTGGVGGAASGTNNALLYALGDDAAGMLVQSVGGGGGIGGAGDSSSYSTDGKGSVGMSVAVGGTGGTGGHAGTATGANTSGIFTRGDGSAGMFVQSVGGGGGDGGGGVASASGGKLSLAVGVGGSGGAGGDGGRASATNVGSIITAGVDASGIYAQSVGGGGGDGGKGGSTAGGADFIGNAGVLSNLIADGFNLGVGTKGFETFTFAVGIADEVFGALSELKQVVTVLQDRKLTPPKLDNLDVSVSVGGSGGAAGRGGDVDVSNAGAILVRQAQAVGIFAHSVGGGGGKAGASAANAASGDDSRRQVSLSVGGSGGAAGDGGAVNVEHSGGSIETLGVLGFGIFAQSVGGGGGTTSLSGTVEGSLTGVGVAIGGSTGASGNGGAVKVTASAPVSTNEKHGIGIFAQSVGGGGGLVRTMTSDQALQPEDFIDNPQARVYDAQSFINVKVHGSPGAAGNGGAVTVRASGAVSTDGLNAHGILAQSVGAGGGALIGGTKFENTDADNGGARGDGGDIYVLVDGSAVRTTKDGAFGIIAQSVGGGGGIVGDISRAQAFRTVGGRVVDFGASNGNGGKAVVDLFNATVETSGAFAPAIFAQSVGGGGGLAGSAEKDSGFNRLKFGSASVGKAGNGRGDEAAVTLASTRVRATGANSPAIVAQSTGGTAYGVIITIDAQSSVMGGSGNTADPTGNAIYISHEVATETVAYIGNKGTIGALSGGAVYSEGPVSIDNGGTITGSITVGTGSRFGNTGTLDAAALNLGGGTLTNAGTLVVGGAGTAGTTAITGDLVQTATGALVVDVDRATGAADALVVSGAANLSGAVRVASVPSRRGATATILTAAGGITGTPAVVSPASAVFGRRALLTSPTTLALAATADFTAGAPNLSAPQSSLAAYLQRGFDGGDAGFDAGFARLATVADQASYLRHLSTLTGQALVSISAIRWEASQTVARAAYGCPTFADASTVRVENDCLWFRASGDWANRRERPDYVGYKWNAGTLKLGGQREVADGWFLGGSVAYETGRLNQRDGLARIKSEAILAALSVTRQAGAWTWQGAADVGLAWFDSSRQIPLANATATGGANAVNAGLHGRAAYRIAGRTAYLEPALELDASYLSTGGYTEAGASPFNLAVRGAHQWVFAATPAVRAGARIELARGFALDLYGGGGVSLTTGGDFDAQASFAAAQAGTGTFRTSIPNDHVVGRATAGLKLITAGGIDVAVQYDGRFSARETAHGAQARFNLRF